MHRSGWLRAAYLPLEVIDGPFHGAKEGTDGFVEMRDGGVLETRVRNARRGLREHHCGRKDVRHLRRVMERARRNLRSAPGNLLHGLADEACERLVEDPGRDLQQLAPAHL